MIRRLTLGLLVVTFIFSATTFVHSGNGMEASEFKKMSKEEKKEKKRLEKERQTREKEEKKRLKREQKKEKSLKQKEECKKCDEKKAEKKAEKERKKQEREEKQKLNKEKKAKKREEKKQSLWNRMFNKEQKNKARAENLKIKSLEKETKQANAAKLKEERYLSSLERKRLADEKRKIRNEKIKVEKDIEKIEHERLMLINKMERRKEAAQDYTLGYYSDLYRRPAWPFEMYFAEQKDIFQVEMKYDYATDAYNSKGSTTDLAKFEFRNGCIEFQDLLLAVKLAKKGILKESFTENNLAAQFLFDTYYNKKLNFLGESNEFDVTLDFARYVWGRNALLGVKIPFGYRSHRLKLSSDIDPFDPAHVLFTGLINENINLPIQTMLDEMLNYAIEPKHLHYLPKTSITGIGDISTFLNLQFKTRYVDRFIVGVNVLWPTAKEADLHKLWAPSLGNDFTKISLFTSVLFNHQKNYFNPHMFLVGTYQVPGHKDRRVPKYISHEKDTTTSNPDVAHGDLVAFRDAAEQQNTRITRFFTELDTTVPTFADHIKSVYIRPGCEFELRLGNIWEKFIFRRAFLDVFYNFRAKWRDHISNSDLPRDEWNPDVLKYQTNQIEHKIALDFAYQIDAKSRVQAGFNYAFAGINIPVTLEGTLTVNVEF